MQVTGDVARGSRIYFSLLNRAHAGTYTTRSHSYATELLRVDRKCLTTPVLHEKTSPPATVQPHLKELMNDKGFTKVQPYLFGQDFGQSAKETLDATDALISKHQRRRQIFKATLQQGKRGGRTTTTALKISRKGVQVPYVTPTGKLPGGKWLKTAAVGNTLLTPYVQMSINSVKPHFNTSSHTNKSLYCIDSPGPMCLK